MSNNPSASPTPDMLPMTVAKMSFLVDRLHQDCSPLQFLRELTKNSIEAIQRLDDPAGEIRWDVDWNRFDLMGEDSAKKLCVIDTGVGMTGEEMVEYINKLSSSIHKQSTSGNFGVGAKIAAAPLNPEGLFYLSWKEGKDYMIHLQRDHDTGEFGLIRFNNGEFWQLSSDDLKPEPIKANGTMVVLLGTSLDHNTMEAPPGARVPSRWVLRYLNSRFFRFPDGVTVKVRRGWDFPHGDQRNYLNTVTGQSPWLNANCQSKGSLRLEETEATVHWWIIKETIDSHSYSSYAPGGHVAVLFQDELYELASSRAGITRLQSFGIIFGCSRVVLYLEVDNTSVQSVTANTARSHLLIANEPLDWPAYATEFRKRMPQELRDYQDEVGMAVSQTDHRKAIRERLKTIRDLFRFGRYRPKPGGGYLADPSQNAGGNPANQGSIRNGASPSGSRGGMKGDIYALFTNETGESAELVNEPIEPEPKWVSEEDGLQLDDRAARYLSDQNLLLINGDFRGFTEMIDRWVNRYSHVPGCRQTIQEVVREWFEQQLIETVMSAHALKQSGKWSSQEVSGLWDEDALTAAVLPRYHIDMNIKRALGHKLGKVPTAV